MVKHIVMWKFKDSPTATREENRARTKELLLELKGVVPGLLNLEVVENFTPGEYELCLYAELESREALQAYQVYPAHQKALPFIRGCTSARAAADYEL